MSAGTITECNRAATAGAEHVIATGRESEMCHILVHDAVAPTTGYRPVARNDEKAVPGSVEVRVPVDRPAVAGKGNGFAQRIQLRLPAGVVPRVGSGGAADRNTLGLPAVDGSKRQTTSSAWETNASYSTRVRVGAGCV